MTEERIYPPMHPGRVLELEFLEPLEMSPYKLARGLGVDPPRVYDIVRGERAITADTALRLARYFGTSAEFWLNLQAHYDLEVEEERIGENIEKQVHEEVRLDIGNRVRNARKSLELSQDALARRADVSLSLVNQIERGVITDPHYSTLVGIANALDMSVGELLGEESAVPFAVPLAEALSASPSPETTGAGEWRARLRALNDDVKTSTALAAKSVQTGLWLGGTTTEDLQNLNALGVEWGVSFEEILDALVDENPGLAGVLDRMARRALEDKEPQRAPVLSVIAGGKTA